MSVIPFSITIQQVISVHQLIRIMYQPENLKFCVMLVMGIAPNTNVVVAESQNLGKCGKNEILYVKIGLQHYHVRNAARLNSRPQSVWSNIATNL